MFFFRFSRCKWFTETWTTNIHKVSNIRIGKRISHKSLPNQKTKNRNGTCTLPDRKTNKNLVPKQTNEIKKRNSSNKRIKRTRKTGTSTKSSRCSGTGASHIRSKLGAMVFILSQKVIHVHKT